MKTCDRCGVTADDVLPRAFVGEILIARGFFRESRDGTGDIVQNAIDPALCTACCSEMPGRAWMMASLAATA